MLKYISVNSSNIQNNFVVCLMQFLVRLMPTQSIFFLMLQYQLCEILKLLTYALSLVYFVSQRLLLQSFVTLRITTCSKNPPYELLLTKKPCRYLISNHIIKKVYACMRVCVNSCRHRMVIFQGTAK